jgi:hypothetical protein
MLAVAAIDGHGVDGPWWSTRSRVKVIGPKYIESKFIAAISKIFSKL